MPLIRDFMNVTPFRSMFGFNDSKLWITKRRKGTFFSRYVSVYDMEFYVIPKLVGNNMMKLQSSSSRVRDSIIHNADGSIEYVNNGSSSS